MSLAPENFDIVGQAMKGEHDVWDTHAQPPVEQSPVLSKPDWHQLGSEGLKLVAPEDLKLLPPPDASTRADLPAPQFEASAASWQNAPAPTPATRGRHSGFGPVDAPAYSYVSTPAPQSIKHFTETNHG